MQSANLPQGSRTPYFLQVLHWNFQPIELMEAYHKAYGDIFEIFSNPNSRTFFVSDPKGIKEILTLHPDQYDAGRGNQLIQPLVGSQSLLLLDSKPHQRQRRLLMPPFHGERMRAYGQLIAEITQQFMLKHTAKYGFLDRSSTQEISLRIILQAVFGLHHGERYQGLRYLLKQMLEVFASPMTATLIFLPSLQIDLGSWSPWGYFIRIRQQVDELLFSEIQERRQALDPGRTDILTLLLMARDEAGEPMTDQELRDELLTILFAGHETTANALNWALYWIHSLPEVHKKLLVELDSSDDLMTLSRLPYLNAVCSETLRIYPILPVTSKRILKTPLNIGSYSFEVGMTLIPCIYLVHQRPDLYPDPKRFNPDRFLERQFAPYEYLPFGGGSRSCIGMAFAQFEIKLILITLLKNWEIRLENQKPLKPVRRGVIVAVSPEFDRKLYCQTPRH